MRTLKDYNDLLEKRRLSDNEPKQRTVLEKPSKLQATTVTIGNGITVKPLPKLKKTKYNEKMKKWVPQNGHTITQVIKTKKITRKTKKITADASIFMFMNTDARVQFLNKAETETWEKANMLATRVLWYPQSHSKKLNGHLVDLIERYGRRELHSLAMEVTYNFLENGKINMLDEDGEKIPVPVKNFTVDSHGKIKLLTAYISSRLFTAIRKEYDLYTAKQTKEKRTTVWETIPENYHTTTGIEDNVSFSYLLLKYGLAGKLTANQTAVLEKTVVHGLPLNNREKAVLHGIRKKFK